MTPKKKTKKSPTRKTKVEPKPEKPSKTVRVRVNRGSIKFEGQRYVKGARLTIPREIAEPLAEPPIGPTGQKTGLPPKLSIID
jgi:hypothetical protein